MPRRKPDAQEYRRGAGLGRLQSGGKLERMARHDARELTTVAIAPDLGERYLGTIYQAEWFQGLYGEDVLSPRVHEAASY